MEWLEETFEGAVNGGLRAALHARRLQPVADVHGETFVAARSSGEVRFHFTRAYVGDYDSVFGVPQLGAYVGLSVTLHECGPHTRIRLVQVCREIVQGSDGSFSSCRPRDEFRAERSGYGDPAASRSIGWRVDQSLGHDSVFWTDAGRKDGRDGSASAPARLLDAPASLPDPHTGRPAANVGKEFRTCVVANTEVLASIAWGYYIDARSVVAMYPAPPLARAGAGDEVYDAIERWDRTPGHRPSGITP